MTNRDNALILRILCELYSCGVKFIVHSWSGAPLKEEQSKKERYFSTQTIDVTCDYRCSEKYTVANNE